MSNASDRDIDPYRLSSPTIAPNDLVGPKPAVYNPLNKQDHWLVFILFPHVIDPSSNHYLEKQTTRQSFCGHAQNMSQPPWSMSF